MGKICLIYKCGTTKPFNKQCGTKPFNIKCWPNLRFKKWENPFNIQCGTKLHFNIKCGTKPFNINRKTF